MKQNIFPLLCKALWSRNNSCYSILFSNLKLKKNKHNIIISRVISNYMGPVYIETPYITMYIETPYITIHIETPYITMYIETPYICFKSKWFIRKSIFNELLKLMSLPTIKWFQVFLSNTNNSIQFLSFVFSKLNGLKYCYLILAIQFIKYSNVIYIYIYIYSHPQKDCFVVSQHFMVARYAWVFKLGSKLGWIFMSQISYPRAILIPFFCEGIFYE